MPTLNDPTHIEAKRVNVIAMEDEAKNLDARLTSLTQRIVSLQDEAEKRRIDMSKAYRERLQARFSDLDVSKALSGYEAFHDAIVLGSVYRLRAPKQAQSLEVDKFSASPVPATLGPISATERMLLSWLIGVGVVGEVRTLLEHGLPARLEMIRKLPEALLVKLADECSSIETYLNVVLELELGKS